MKLNFALLGRTDNIESQNYSVLKRLCTNCLKEWKPLCCMNSQSEQTDFSTEAIKQENVSVMYSFQTHITLIPQDNILKPLLPLQNSLFTQAI